MKTIVEPARDIPVIYEADVCVLGGSCTGVFAAVRAARLGARVALVEKQNAFGGVAASGLVNIWHSIYDNEKQQKIISGLSEEVLNRLKRRGAVTDLEETLKTDQYNAYYFNSEELKIELDQLLQEAGVKVYLHTYYSAPYIEDGVLKGVIIENKSGRSAICAKVFIDATGDGDLCVHLGVPSYVPEHIQPPTMCAKWYSPVLYDDHDVYRLFRAHREEFGLREDWGWHAFIPGAPQVTMRAETHVFDVNCADADVLTYSEMEGRRQMRALMDLIRKYDKNGKNLALVDLASYIGVRETRHVKMNYRITEQELLQGKRYDDAILNGTYCVDIHHSNRRGSTMRYLDGVEKIIEGDQPQIARRWREETPENPGFYQVPYRAIQVAGIPNVLAAGRMMDAEEGAYGALRVMINLNQLGEAAGCAAALAVQKGVAPSQVDAGALRRTLKDGGSIVL